MEALTGLLDIAVHHAVMVTVDTAHCSPKRAAAGRVGLARENQQYTSLGCPCGCLGEWACNTSCWVCPGTAPSATQLHSLTHRASGGGGGPGGGPGGGAPGGGGARLLWDAGMAAPSSPQLTSPQSLSTQNIPHGTRRPPPRRRVNIPAAPAPPPSSPGGGGGGRRGSLAAPPPAPSATPLRCEGPG
jgi:hypothetical protein